MASSKCSAVFGALLALTVALLCVDQILAQKTIKNSFQQSISSGSAPQSVYGGYEQSPVSQQRQQSPVSQQRRTQQQTQTYVSRQRTESVRQPAYQQQPQQQPQQQQQQQQEPQQQEQAASSSDYNQQAEADAEPASYGSVQGQPGQDFPAYTRVPKTSFSCDGLPYDYGMYADEETGCQAYHVCYNGRKDSFLCGVGTVFNQRILHCDYWYSVECGKSSQYYSSNAYMGSSQPEPGPAEAGAQVAQQRPAAGQNSYRRPEQAASSSSSSSTSVNRPASPSKVQRNQQSSSSSFSRNTQQVEENY